MLLEVRNLTTYFYTQDGIVKAVDGVSYDIDRGETVALVGESGCGKTVNSLSILRLVPEPPGKIIAGTALFDGVDLLQLSKSEMRQVRGTKIAMIFQEPMTSLNPVLTVGRQISEALERLQMGKTEALKETGRLLGLVGIPQAERRLNEYPHHFSGGMRQRVMIAMAISCKPQLIIADEPTTALDVTIQAQLLELIKGLTQEMNMALILVTHNLGIVARYARRVYVMYAGKIVEHGPVRDIYSNPCHPYTAGLLASVPRLDEPAKTRLESIEGLPPDLISPPEGCSFQPRCGFASTKCQTETYALLEVAPGHFSCCWIAQNGEKPWQKKSYSK